LGTLIPHKDFARAKAIHHAGMERGKTYINDGHIPSRPIRQFINVLSLENKRFLKAYVTAYFMLDDSLPHKNFRGTAMNHHQVEKDIQHLEQVMTRISAADRIPLSYWRNRLKSVMGFALVPSQASRVRRLHATLSALEAGEGLALASGNAR